MIIAGHGHNHKGVSAYNRNLNTITPLTDLPKGTRHITAIRSGMWLYILGGYITNDADNDADNHADNDADSDADSNAYSDDEDVELSNQFYRICLETHLRDKNDDGKILFGELFPAYWEKLPNLIQSVDKSVVVSNTCYLYVIGGFSDSKGLMGWAYMFDKRLFYWTKLPYLPREVDCNTDDAAVVDAVVYVFQPSATLVLKAGSKSWKVINHTTLGKLTDK